MYDDLPALAIHGGPSAVTRPLPHEHWPPPADEAELAELAGQRNQDISIRGRTGPIKALEEDFLSFLEHRVDHAVTFNSGTSALLAAYFALGVREGTEVVGPALTYHAALSPAYVLGAEVVLVDIEENSRCIDPALIEASITERTRVLTVVHQWGHPCNMDAVMSIARRHRLRVLEDCSHAHGSTYKGRPVGTFGDAAVFSLQTNKAVFAGEGGILVTSDADVHARATLLGHYRDRSRDELGQHPGQRYWVTGYGLKLRMSPFNAIVARHSLRHFPDRMEQRHRCLRYLTERLSTIEYVAPTDIADHVGMGGWYGFKPLYRPEMLGGLPRADLIRALRAEGVDIAVPSAPVLSGLPLYADAGDPLFPPRRRRHRNRLAQHPVASDVERRALSLPTFGDWAQDRAVIDGYVEAFAKVGARYPELLPGADRELRHARTA